MIEALEPAQTAADGEPVEAVIISGPRKGQIIRLSEEAIPEITDEEIQLLNEALDQLIAALDRCIEAFRSPVELR